MLPKAYRTQSPIDADLGVMKAVTEVAGNFGGQSNLPKSMLAECCEFFKNHFASLAPEEIVTAFRMAASRELDVDAALYGGNFNVERLGGVLSAYRAHRNKAQASMEQARKKAQLEASLMRASNWMESEAGAAALAKIWAADNERQQQQAEEAKAKARLMRLESEAARLRAEREESLTELVKMAHWEKQIDVEGMDESGNPVTLRKWVMCDEAEQGAEVMRENWVRQDTGIAAYLRLVEFLGLFVTFDSAEAEHVAREWGEVWKQEWADRHPLLKSRWKEYARAQAKSLRLSLPRSLTPASILEHAAKQRYPSTEPRILSGKIRATLRKWENEWPDVLEGYMERGIVPPTKSSWLLHRALLWSKENTGSWPTQWIMEPASQGQQ